MLHKRAICTIRHGKRPYNIQQAMLLILSEESIIVLTSC